MGQGITVKILKATIIMTRVTITARHLWHARTHKRDCSCGKSDEPRDPKCETDWPGICPHWAYQLYRHRTGDFSGPPAQPPQAA